MQLVTDCCKLPDTGWGPNFLILWKKRNHSTAEQSLQLQDLYFDFSILQSIQVTVGNDNSEFRDLERTCDYTRGDEAGDCNVNDCTMRNKGTWEGHDGL